MKQWKHKILLSAVGLILMGGLAYQNCASVNQSTSSGSASPSSDTLTIEGKQSVPADKRVTLVLKDGTQILARVPQIVPEKFNLVLNVGTVIAVRVNPPEENPDGTCTDENKGEDCEGIQGSTSMCEQKCKDGIAIKFPCASPAPLCPETGATKK